MKIMVIVDCQKDFIDGSLGTSEAQAMIPRLVEKIKAEPEDTMFVFKKMTNSEIEALDVLFQQYHFKNY